MASTYSANLKIELIATGEQSGDWGVTTNENFTNVFEEAIVGRGNPEFASDADLTLTYTNTVGVQTARNLYLNVTSSLSLTATRVLIVPTVNKNYVVENNTTGGQSITVKTVAGTGITIPNGRKAALYVDNTNVVVAWDWVDINGGSIDGTPVGASTASTGAFTNLTSSSTTTLNGTTVPASKTLVTTTDTQTLTNKTLTTPIISQISNTGTLTLPISTDTLVGRATIDTLTNKTLTSPTVNDGALSGIFSGTPTFSGNITYSSTGAIKIPASTTVNRPSPVTGMIRFNTNFTQFEGYNGSTWTGIGGGATGGGGDEVFIENGVTVTSNYTLTTYKNAMSVGPISVASGVSVTVPSGQRWVIL